MGPIRKKMINNWDNESDKLWEIEEPAALRDVELGDDFIAVTNKYFAEFKVAYDAEKMLAELANEVVEVRGDLAKLWQQRLEEQEKK